MASIGPSRKSTEQVAFQTGIEQTPNLDQVMEMLNSRGVEVDEGHIESKPEPPNTPTGSFRYRSFENKKTRFDTDGSDIIMTLTDKDGNKEILRYDINGLVLPVTN